MKPWNLFYKWVPLKFCRCRQQSKCNHGKLSQHFLQNECNLSLNPFEIQFKDKRFKFCSCRLNQSISQMRLQKDIYLYRENNEQLLSQNKFKVTFKRCPFKLNLAPIFDPGLVKKYQKSPRSQPKKACNAPNKEKKLSWPTLIRQINCNHRFSLNLNPSKLTALFTDSSQAHHKLSWSLNPK